MRTLYVTIIGMAPNTREAFQERMKTQGGRWDLADYFFVKVRPTLVEMLRKDGLEEGRDFESMGGVTVMPGDEFVGMLNPDATLPFASRIPIDYLFEEWLDVGPVFKSCESFEDELHKLKNTMLLFFTIDE